jgi:hypothetical protein
MLTTKNFSVGDRELLGCGIYIKKSYLKDESFNYCLSSSEDVCSGCRISTDVTLPCKHIKGNGRQQHTHTHIQSCNAESIAFI